jgi:hypothetical protein
MLFKYKGEMRLLAMSNLFSDSYNYERSNGSMNFEISATGSFKINIAYGTFSPRRARFEFDGTTHMGKSRLPISDPNPIASSPLSNQLQEAGFAMIDYFKGNGLWFKEFTATDEDPRLLLIELRGNRMVNLWSSTSAKCPNFRRDGIKGSIVAFQNGKYLTSQNYELYFQWCGSDDQDYLNLYATKLCSH